ncbi:MAG: sensor of ECF-type sigma factor [Flavobacteriaceae bacterium]|nr:sensor of ECF-type sigma factor [Flavobacteriaceae bacterium]
MNMKKILIVMVLIVANFSFAQGFKEKKEKIKALKVAYITEKLDFTTDEAQKFWPIYNTFDEKQFEIRHNKMKAIIKKIEEGGMENISEKEAQNLISQIENSEDELHNLKKKFMQDLQKVIPAKKIILLKKTEEEFNRKLLREFKERKKN